jgi:hypothetical protein
MPSFRPALVPDPRPALKFVVVQWDTAATRGKDEHAGGDQLVTDMCCRAGVPGSGCDAGSFGQDLITAIRDVAEFGNRCGQVTLLGGVSDGGAMQCAVQELISTSGRAC